MNDRGGGPFWSGLSFTFESHRGLRVRADGRGCPLWYLTESDYDRAFAEADDPGPRVHWEHMVAVFPDDPQYPHREQW
jgi:hypothetical protein